MSRRAYLQDLVRDLRRYLSWQQAEGVPGIMPAPKEHQEILEAREAAMQEKKLLRLRSQITGQQGPHKSEQISKAPPLAPPPKTPSQPAKSSPGSAPERAAGRVTANTPIWQRRKAIYQMEERQERPPQKRPPAERTRPAGATQGRKIPETPAEKIAFLRNYLRDCRRCPLHQGRTNVVFGEGDPEATLMFIGEAPGFHEDQQGKPFVGKSGDLLTNMIRAMGYERDEVYIANIIKCRPPENRNPAPDEILKCSPYIKKQIEVVAPRVIVTLGKFAANTLLDSDASLGTMRGRWHSFQEIPVMPTYHPAYLLRSPEHKREAWADLQMVMQRLGLRQT